MTTNEQVILQSILAKIDRVERAILEQRLQQSKMCKESYLLYRGI
ncbi:hypothetical protein A79_4853 [Vibrio parahaemolyticus AQ3810]|nr:hypothetical protein A79_4853 [Vibrio parahaemolyticus AQ3810]